MSVIYLKEEVGTIVSKITTTPLYYMFGHPLEIVGRLQEITQSTTDKDKKYPLIALFADIPIDKTGPVGFYGRAKLTIIIATLADPNMTAEQRIEATFKPILQPIKEQLVDQLFKHKQFSFADELKYWEIEHYYWGRQGLYGNTANIFNDYIDAIELRDIDILIKNKIC